MHDYWYLVTDVITRLHLWQSTGADCTTLLVVMDGRRNYWRASAAAVECGVDRLTVGCLCVL